MGRHSLLISLIMVAALVFIGSRAIAGQQEIVSGGPAVPEEFRQGETLYTVNCAVCHGMRGVGTDKGPPLVHKIYEPGHHSDMSFYLAAMRGVRAHHWRFGDMPRIEGVGEGEIGSIVLYVRWLQRLAGIE